MKKYFIQLTPLSPSFFGGESQRILGNKQAYFQHSESFPQQTTLLGMLRFQLLKQHDLLPLSKRENQATASKLIGSKSFTVGTKNQAFGKIAKIGPLAFFKKEEQTTDTSKPFFLSSKERVFYKGKKADLLIDFTQSVKKYSFQSKTYTNIPKLFIKNEVKEEGYIAKYTFVEELKSFLSTEKTADLDKVFNTHTQIGIEKSEDGGTKDEAFFKSEYKTLKKEWAFGFTVEMLADNILSTTEDIVLMGKEQSAFRLKVSPFDEKNHSYEDSFCKFSDTKGVALYKFSFLTDAFISDESEFNDLLEFAILDTIPFRNMVATVNEGRNYSEPFKSEKLLNLVKRGSIVYTRKPNELHAFLVEGDSKQFKQIGYNHFVITPVN